MPTRPPTIYSGRITHPAYDFTCDTCGREVHGHAYKVGGPEPLRIYEECVECWMLPRMPYMKPLRGI